MPTLLDHVDHFSFTAQAIRTSCQRVSIDPVGPYVRAVLHTRIGDKARDIDESEIGLFTLVMAPNAHGRVVEDDDAAMVSVNEVARVEFPGATPLRKPFGAGRATKNEEKEPEIYAEAALKYLDKYQAIRPMPRARGEIIEVLDRLADLRDEISKLDDTVQEGELQDANPFATVKDEEKRIQELNFRIKQLRARKDVLLKRRGKLATANKPSSSAAHADNSQEDAFWSEPAPQPTILKARQSLLLPAGSKDGDDSLLLDAEMDMSTMGDMIGDMSLGSIQDVPTPLPPSRPPVKKATPPEPALSTTQKLTGKNTVTKPNAGTRRTSTISAHRTGSKKMPKAALKPPQEPELEPGIEPNSEPERKPEAVNGDEDEDDNDDEEKTVVLRKPPPPSLPMIPHPPPQVEPLASPKNPSPTSKSPKVVEKEKERLVVPTTPTHLAPAVPVVLATPASERKNRPIITTEVERIVAKIWQTVGDVVMPGHPFNTASAATTNKPPKAKETIALLQNISSQRPSPLSPSTHSSLSLTIHTHDAHHPTAQQILTAHLLLTLLNSPNQSLPLSKAKESLAAKGLSAPAPTPGTTAFTLAGLGGGGQGLESRALYACVAKRLIKIDRGAREQTVKFNV